MGSSRVRLLAFGSWTDACGGVVCERSWGMSLRRGICGHVAKSKRRVNISTAFLLHCLLIRHCNLSHLRTPRKSDTSNIKMSSSNSTSNTSSGSTGGGKSIPMTQSDASRIQSSQVSSPAASGVIAYASTAFSALAGFRWQGGQADSQAGHTRRRHVIVWFRGAGTECWRSECECGRWWWGAR